MSGYRCPSLACHAAFADVDDLNEHVAVAHPDYYEREAEA